MMDVRPVPRIAGALLSGRSRTGMSAVSYRVASLYEPAWAQAAHPEDLAN